MCCVFFVQAEDGIRDLVRSRGLGDVYKRQDQYSPYMLTPEEWDVVADFVRASVSDLDPEGPHPVSYTHLTLPTSDLV